ncbi:MAG: 1,6-anhydro-N-acetylmuramyl-L-alanine amidase AmpD [Gammaproteobacteria bacterium]|nr:1,6-anhydro-N-acetylmuramyl-L-alanine amidase AmpD [Gammaproteobacteria bacterium]MBQ0840831.1 1,6-anhydro-N-acetylmuramyl-L-alanine amidase AmpD [Gammaproteobacteria bacterium]
MTGERDWLAGARACPSPNQGERPADSEVSLLVIHNISLPPGQFGGGYIEQFFSNTLNRDAHPYFAEIADLQVSSHLLIDRLGEVVQFVALNRRAWHAGESSFAGCDNCNDYAIGIELEGSDTQPYSDKQYQSLAQVCRHLMAAYPALTAQRMVGHSDISPGRKTDPGPAFDWPRFFTMLASTGNTQGGDEG